MKQQFINLSKNIDRSDIGVVLLSAGLWMIYPPIALIAFGLVLIFGKGGS